PAGRGDFLLFLTGRGLRLARRGLRLARLPIFVFRGTGRGRLFFFLLFFFFALFFFLFFFFFGLLGSRFRFRFRRGDFGRGDRFGFFRLFAFDDDFAQAVGSFAKRLLQLAVDAAQRFDLFGHLGRRAFSADTISFVGELLHRFEVRGDLASRVPG